MHKFTSIEGIANSVRTTRILFGEDRGVVRYRGTVKLHGTNAGVACLEEGRLRPQSRNRVLSMDSDHEGFARFVAEREATVHAWEERIRKHFGVEGGTLVLFGEWVGPGVQKGIGLSKLPERQWVIFQAQWVPPTVPRSEEGDDPWQPQTQWLDLHTMPWEDLPTDRVKFVGQAPVYYVDLNLDFPDLRQIETWTAEVDQECPWATLHGVTGPGEGIVWTPLGKWANETAFWFKTKGAAHKANKEKKLVSVDPEVLTNIEEFIEFAVTENRLEQGVSILKEMGKPLTMQSTKDFLGWVLNDIERECAAELERLGLSFPTVTKAIQPKAVAFFKKITTDFSR